MLYKDIGNPVIERTQEYMNGQYCDYYIYPIVGQKLNIRSESSYLKIRLNEPFLHNFANGEYVVKNNNRHVIRVSYSGIKKKPENMTYRIDVSLQ